MNSEFKIAVIGGRIPSLACAMSLAETGFSLDLYSPRPVERYAPAGSEGINAAVDQKGEGDSQQVHFGESFAASVCVGDQAYLKGMCEKAPDILNLLVRLGVPFVRTDEGSIDFKCTGPSTYHRTAHAGDETGRQIHRVLCDQVRRWEVAGRIVKREYQEVLDFIIDDDGICRGLVSLDLRTMEVGAFTYDAVILAVGGPLMVFGETACVYDDFAPMLKAYQHGARWVQPHSFLWEPGVVSGKAAMVQDEPNVNPDDGDGHNDTPLARRHLGGLFIDDRYKTEIPHLFAAGECAYLGEGECILPGNELLMDIYGGLGCAESVVTSLNKPERKPVGLDNEFLDGRCEEAKNKLLTISPSTGDVPGDPQQFNTPACFYRELTRLMQRFTGPGCPDDTLAEIDKALLAEIRPLFVEIKAYDGASYANRDIPFINQLGLLIDACETIIRSALVAVSIDKDSFPIIAKWSDEGSTITFSH